MAEKDFLNSQLAELSATRASLQPKFVEAQAQVERHVEDLCEKAGILKEIQKTRDDLTKFRESLQRQADELTGKIAAFEMILDKFHRAPVEPGTVMHGIDISKLDWQTLLMVMNGNRQTIAALGGTFEPEPVAVPALESDYSLSDLQASVITE